MVRSVHNVKECMMVWELRCACGNNTDMYMQRYLTGGDVVSDEKYRWHIFFFFSSRRRHTRCSRDWSSDVCSSDLSFPSFVVSTWPPVRDPRGSSAATARGVRAHPPDTSAGPRAPPDRRVARRGE